MASMTRSDSGDVTTYVITDLAGSTLTVEVTQTEVTGNTVTFSSSGGLLPDGLQMLSTLAPMLMTGLLPPASVPVL